MKHIKLFESTNVSSLRDTLDSYVAYEKVPGLKAAYACYTREYPNDATAELGVPVEKMRKNMRAMIADADKSKLENLKDLWDDLADRVEESYTDGFRAYLIPNDKRDEYFDFKEKLDTAAHNHVQQSGWDTFSDPVIKIHDITVFSQKNVTAIEAFMKRIGAKDVTDTYIGESLDESKQQKNLSDMIVKKFGYRVVKNPSFDTTKNQVVLERERTRTPQIRIILDSEGDDSGCTVEIFAFDNANTMNLEWSASFGFNTPEGALLSFIQKIS